MRILLVEDDGTLGNAVNRSLVKSGYAVDWAKDGQDAEFALQSNLYEAVVLDLGLPRLDGFEVLRRMRARGLTVPVVILTARDGLDDRIKGLDLGADDYMAKPFKLPELEARLRAHIRRSHTITTSTIQCGRLCFDTQNRLVTADGIALSLSSRELGVLETLLLCSGRVVSKNKLMEALCNWDEDLCTNAIEVYVHRLRKKLETYDINIRTVRGLGYLLDNQPDE